MKPSDTFDPSGAFYVGQDVVCVRADFDPAQKTTIKSELVEGKVYKIRWLGIYSHYLDGDYLGIKVEGIYRGTCPFWGYVDQPFYANRFRPLVMDRIAQFRNMLTDKDAYVPWGPEEPKRAPVKETEDA